MAQIGGAGFLKRRKKFRNRGAPYAVPPPDAIQKTMDVKVVEEHVDDSLAPVVFDGTFDRTETHKIHAELEGQDAGRMDRKTIKFKIPPVNDAVWSPSEVLLCTRVRIRNGNDAFDPPDLPWLHHIPHGQAGARRGTPTCRFVNGFAMGFIKSGRWMPSGQPNVEGGIQDIGLKQRLLYHIMNNEKEKDSPEFESNQLMYQDLVSSRFTNACGFPRNFDDATIEQGNSQEERALKAVRALQNRSFEDAGGWVEIQTPVPLQWFSMDAKHKLPGVVEGNLELELHNNHHMLIARQCDRSGLGPALHADQINADDGGVKYQVDFNRTYLEIQYSTFANKETKEKFEAHYFAQKDKEFETYLQANVERSPQFTPRADAGGKPISNFDNIKRQVPSKFFPIVMSRVNADGESDLLTDPFAITSADCNEMQILVDREPIFKAFPLNMPNGARNDGEYIIKTHLDLEGRPGTEERVLRSRYDALTVHHGLAFPYVDLTNTKFQGLKTSSPHIDGDFEVRLRFGNNGDANGANDCYFMVVSFHRNKFVLHNPLSNGWSDVKKPPIAAIAAREFSFDMKGRKNWAS